MLTVLLATRNRHKVRELRRLLKGIPIRFLTLDRFPDFPPVHENGATFRENAVKKARESSRRTILPVLAEDSGLEVWALNGRPGVRSARYAGSTQDDRGNQELAAGNGAATEGSPRGASSSRSHDGASVRKLLREMRVVPAHRRQARFVCVMAFAIGGKLLRTFEGNCSGSISFQPTGRTGFGYDPVFIPRGHRKTMAQLGARVKDKISHRVKAAAKFERWIMTAD